MNFLTKLASEAHARKAASQLSFSVFSFARFACRNPADQNSVIPQKTLLADKVN
jgi:hypothetical protein